jgi:hypothetical protein
MFNLRDAQCSLFFLKKNHDFSKFTALAFISGNLFFFRHLIQTHSSFR